MLRPALVLILLLAPLLAGCTGLGGAPAESRGNAPDRLLVRMFVDDPDRDGSSEMIIRLAAYAPPEQVQPFRGELLVLVRSQSADPSWTPRVVTATVMESDFVAAVLPYYQIRVPAGFLARGDGVLVEAEATLLDGTVLRGGFEAVA